MKLIEFINAMVEIAKEQPAVRTVVHNDIYKLNALPDVEYGVFAYVQGTHRQTEDSFISFNFTLFYVDRLTEDRGNEVEVQSTGLDVLRNIILKMEELYTGSEKQPVSYVTFTERFSDECAGAYATVSFQVATADVCPEDY